MGERLESVNAIKGVRDGMYPGYWGGWKFWVRINNRCYEWDAPEGIKGTDQVYIEVKKGKAFIDTDHRWWLDDFPDKKYKHIKVIYVCQQEQSQQFGSASFDVRLDWKFTYETEEELLEQLPKGAEIINILTYEC